MGETFEETLERLLQDDDFALRFDEESRKIVDYVDLLQAPNLGVELAGFEGD